MTDQQKRLAEVSLIAVAVEAETGVPASSTVAQWAVESRWGAKPCGKANYFGIKRAERHPKFCVVSTREFFTQVQIDRWNSQHPDRPARKTGKMSSPGKFEVMLDDQFADYDCLADSVRDYAWLVSHGVPYAEAWKQFQADRNVAEFVAGIAGKYSTSSAYTSLVNTIAGQNNVREAIEAARKLL